MGITGGFSTQGSTWLAWKQRATPAPPRPVRWAMTWEPPSATSPSPKPTWRGSRKLWGSLGSSRSACPCGGSGRGLGSGGSGDRPQLCLDQPSCSSSESYVAHLFIRIFLHEAFLLGELDVGLSFWRKIFGNKIQFELKRNKPQCVGGEAEGM